MNVTFQNQCPSYYPHYRIIHSSMLQSRSEMAKTVPIEVTELSNWNIVADCFKRRCLNTWSTMQEIPFILLSTSNCKHLYWGSSGEPANFMLCSCNMGWKNYMYMTCMSSSHWTTQGGCVIAKLEV